VERQIASFLQQAPKPMLLRVEN